MDSQGITVNVGIFSGRPNPEMTLVDDEAETVAGMLREVIGGRATHPQPRPKLGRFYGFLIKPSAEIAKRMELPAEVSIYEGIVAEPKKSAESGWRDLVGLEQLLLEHALRNDFGELLERVGVDTSGSSDQAD